MKNLNWGIIGCGDVTEIKSGPAFNRIDQSKLVAVMRRNAQKAEDYAARHGVPRWYDNAYDLINDPEVNAVYVATPPLQHEVYTVASLMAGKPVYVEKPMTMNEESAIKMLQASERTGVKLTVAHYRRGLPMFNEIKQLLANGTIGKVRLVSLKMLQSPHANIIANVEENWRVDPKVAGGGLFHDLAPHQLDLMLYFFGDVLHAAGASLNQGGEYAADDAVAATILFENGVLFNGLWSFTVPVEETKDLCEIIGSEGKVSFPIFGNEYIIHKQGKTERMVFEHPPHIQQPMIEQVAAYFRGEAPNPCGAEEGVKIMRLLDTVTKK